MDRGHPLAGSTLNRIILKTNPGEDLKAEKLIRQLNRLTIKSKLISEEKKGEFSNRFQSQSLRRKKLYEKLRPKLDPSVREAIERIKEKQKSKSKLSPKKVKPNRQNVVRKAKQTPSVDGSINTQYERQSVTSLDWTSDTGLDLSRRSSLKSSLLGIGVSRGGSPGPCFTENPLSSLTTRRDSRDRNKPEVVVTDVIKTGQTPDTSPREKVEKITAFMNLLPAPTSARFVGKMHKLKSDIDKKREEEKGSSRRSSVAPTTETIEEARETESTQNSPRATQVAPASFPAASIVKLSMGKFSKKLKQEMTNEIIKTNKTPNTILPCSNNQSSPRSRESATPATSRKTSPSSVRKTSPMTLKKSPRRPGLHVQAFKSKGLHTNKKPQLESPKPVVTISGGYKKLKPRLFFVEKPGLTDDEVLNNIGREVISRTEYAESKTFKRESSTLDRKDNHENKNKLRVPPPIFHVGNIRGRLSNENAKRKRNGNNPKNNHISQDHLQNTKFLGKMVFSKDKHGLLTGNTDNNDEMDNPIFVALDQLKMRAQQSEEANKHRVTPTSQRSIINYGQEGKGRDLGEGDVVKVLESELSTVRQVSAAGWNNHNQVQGNKKLKSIFIPY